MGAGCVYEMGFVARDIRADNWDFSFVAEGYGDADLFVDNAYATGEHGGGQYYTPDDYHADWDFDWNGDLLQTTIANGERGHDFSEHIDLVTNNMFGNVIVW